MLTALGERQAAHVADSVGNCVRSGWLRIRMVATSPLMRAVQTAAPLVHWLLDHSNTSDADTAVQVVVNASLTEHDHGAAACDTGSSPRDLRSANPRFGECDECVCSGGQCLRRFAVPF